jgi:hypothetical protein
MAGRLVRVALRDGRWAELSAIEEVTGPLGSFSGWFLLPATGTAGQWELTCDAPEGREVLRVGPEPTPEAAVQAAVRATAVPVGQALETAWEPGCPGKRALVEVFHDGASGQRFWTEPRADAGRLRFPVGKELRGGFVLRLLQVCGGRLHFRDFPVRVPWDDPPLGWAGDESPSGAAGEGPRVLRLRLDGWPGETSGGTRTIAAEAAAVWWNRSIDPVAAPAWRSLAFGAGPPAAPRPVVPDRPGRPVVCRGDGWLGQPAGGPFPGRAEYIRELQTRGIWPRAANPALLSPEAAGWGGAELVPEAGGPRTTESPLAEGELPPESGNRPAAGLAGLSAAFPEDPAVVFLPRLPVSPDGRVEIPLPASPAKGPWRLYVLVHTADGRSSVLTLDVPLP